MNLNESPEVFSDRHIGPHSKDITEMLKAIGADSMEHLIEDTLPASIRLKEELNTGKALSEKEYLHELKGIIKQNKVFKSYIGQGYYGCHVPSVIQRNILENPGWYTQYTPYQAEISQGRLQALLNFQTMVNDLTGMQVANASLLDEGTAAAEAMFMLYNATRKNPERKNAFIFRVAENCYTQTIDILKTRAAPLGIEIEVSDPEAFEFDEKVFGILLQYPDREGNIEGCEFVSGRAKGQNCPVVVAADLMSLVLLKPPGEFGADVVVGSAQRFGVPMGFGGPHAAFFATRESYKRQIPGRIIGVSKDISGKPALRMALQTREQHIRREKATSNICTAQVLLAVMSSMYAVYHGPKKLKEIAERIHFLTDLLAQSLTSMGFTLKHKHFFDTLFVNLNSEQAIKIREAALAKEINFNYPGHKQGITLSLDETVDLKKIDEIIEIFTTVGGVHSTINPNEYEAQYQIPQSIKRTTNYLSHPVFNKYHSETEMMRYIKKLETKDLSLNWSMIPLGSCTMKLNAVSEMIPVTWDENANMHPFAPEDQTLGYQILISKLGDALANITGLPGVSFQPNAGSQGEFAGLLVIRAYHQSRGEDNRKVILIPSSAHGTNPASAALAGMEIVIVKCDVHGNIDVDDLIEKIFAHKANLAGLMVTYPSTHGVFEDEIQNICEEIHKGGGLVYMDGANMNAQVGLSNPKSIGADVCHLNLHKTFSIPHGGGGPGMGPICVTEKLIPFLPGHSEIKTGGENGIGSVSAAPYGSGSILCISWGYIRMLGAAGMKKSTEVAILNANYLLHKLKEHYPILYVGKKGRVAHEFILDFRPFKQSAGVEVVDIAKRLMDYGFHAPTVSFPVAGTLMIEPTESESLEELDRFCEALISIRKEIEDIEEGKADKQSNLIKNAPHTIHMICSADWPYTYTRDEAVFPLEWVRADKFWPATARIDNTYGDKHLVCNCLPLEEYAG